VPPSTQPIRDWSLGTGLGQPWRVILFNDDYPMRCMKWSPRYRKLPAAAQEKPFTSPTRRTGMGKPWHMSAKDLGVSRLHEFYERLTCMWSLKQRKGMGWDGARRGVCNAA
jgi:hypothetical protein